MKTNTYKKKKRKKRNPAFLLTVFLFQLETTPLHCDALGDGAHHSRLSLGWDGACLIKMGQPTIALVVGPPLRKDKPLGWEGFSKLEKSMDF